jgi:hypothetical protein
MSERYKSRTREATMRGPAEEQEKTDKLKAMIQILQEKLTKVKRGREGGPDNFFPLRHTSQG